MKDLVVLVADKNMEHALKGILGRPAALHIRPITFDIFIHPRRDPGVLNYAPNFLRLHMAKYRYALVLFDREGCGCNETAEVLEERVKRELQQSGWQNAEAVILDPELEVWVFVDSPHVPQVIADGDEQLCSQKLTHAEKSRLNKPARPKELMETLLREKRIPRSSSLYLKLAQKVSLSNCSDPAFLKLRQILQEWFPPR
ncbi:MAG: hypothetical protein N3E46_11695 [Gemmataceae bacterium]|nr:hypothetical protein [Gemmataceae bacterium]